MYVLESGKRMAPNLVLLPLTVWSCSSYVQLGFSQTNQLKMSRSIHSKSKTGQISSSNSRRAGTSGEDSSSVKLESGSAQQVHSPRNLHREPSGTDGWHTRIMP